MSTKIYDAYRIPRDNDILTLLKSIKEKCIKVVSNDSNLLKRVHISIMGEAIKSLSEDEKNHKAKYFIDEHKRGYIDDLWVEETLDKFDKSPYKSRVSIGFLVSIFYDSDYWYLKFFANEVWQCEVLRSLEKDSILEDYHYQNQCDPPENVDYSEYESRSDKWDQLLKSSGGNYREGFQYTLFDAYEFRLLLTKNYYKGYKTKEELYSHLAYKFDGIENKDDE
jgi:hypothetical protein